MMMTRQIRSTTGNFIAARNFNGRPTLMHRIHPSDQNFTLCGYDMMEWSRVYFKDPIDILLCLRCKRFMTLMQQLDNVVNIR